MAAGLGWRRWLACASASLLVTGLLMDSQATADPQPRRPSERVVLPAPASGPMDGPPSQALARLKPGATLSLAEVVDIALSNSPLTRASYHQARLEAAKLGSERGDYWPQLDATVGLSRAKQPAIDGSGDLPLTGYGPSATLSLLLLDFGGRSGRIAEARQSLLAADWRHNAGIHDVALAVQQAFFEYLNGKGQLDAARTTLKQAQTSLEAAKTRHDAGIATIADVLQAQTALAQAQLDVEGIEGQTLALRGALATAMGLPANVPFDVGMLPQEIPLDRARAAIDSLIAEARLNRPDLAALRAQAQKLAAHEGVARSALLPSLSLQAGVNRAYYSATDLDVHRDGWSARLQLTIPVFHGFSRLNDLRAAREDTAAAWAQAAAYEQRVVLDVWTSYYTLETAAQRVRTSRMLLESATQSEQVALGRYKEGVGTVLDLLSAQAALASARAQEIQARSDWYVAVAALAHAAGRMLPQDDVAVVIEEKKD